MRSLFKKLSPFLLVNIFLIGATLSLIEIEISSSIPGLNFSGEGIDGVG